MQEENALATGRIAVGYSTDQFVSCPVLFRLIAKHPGIRIEARAMASEDLLALPAGGWYRGGVS